MIASAPGRVNLIGDHTDHSGGLVLPMAIQLGTVVRGEPGGDRIRLASTTEARAADLSVRVTNPDAVEPGWTRYVAGVVAELSPTTGFTGTVDTTLPVGAGLSSSAALEVAVALALGFEGDHLALAQLCQRAEHRATGVPCGIMDQLVSAAGVAGHALLIDCGSLTTMPVPLPEATEVLVAVGPSRALVGSAYAERVADCQRAAEVIGPLRAARPGDEAALADPRLRARARHVLSENERVRRFVDALSAQDLPTAGTAMDESHASLRDDFETSTAAMDEIVGALRKLNGVHGARITGGGFGGCAVALAERGAVRADHVAGAALLRVQARDGASVTR